MSQQLKHTQRIWLALVLVLGACAWPRSAFVTPAALPTGSISLSGTITGLASNTSADVRLELLAADQSVGQGQVLARFRVTNGPWEQSGMGLAPGRYGLVAEANGYVNRFGTTTIEIRPGGGAWSFRHLDFELLRPEDAVARVGVPLCTTAPPGGGEFSVPEGPPTATPTYTPSDTTVTVSTPGWPPGTCYAGQFDILATWSAGLYGVVSGLPTGQAANILLYLAPAAPGENYSIGSAPPLDGSWHYPGALNPIAKRAKYWAGEPLTVTLTVTNGPWGFIDNGLIGRKYLVLAQAAGLAADPPGYQVVIFGGMIIGAVGGVDFDFGTK